jgi:hypothetical protein
VNKPSKRRSVRVSVKAPLLDVEPNEKLPATAAYVFSAGGKLLAREKLDPKGAADIEFDAPASPTGIRVVVGPVLESEEGLEALLRRGAQEKHLRLEPQLDRLEAQVPLYADIWRCWLLGLCLVRGTLLKRIEREGVVADFPVCNATVEIYEVDPFPILVAKLPLEILRRLREILTRPPIPIPEPDPDPFKSIRLRFEPAMRAAQTPSLAEADRHAEAEGLAALRSLAEGSELRFLALNGSDRAFRDALVKEAALIRPLLCWIYPIAVTKQRIGTAVTNDCGHFSTFVFRGCQNPDVPDLYFKATQKWFGVFDIPIYAPTPIACHTFWNYVCGTEVTLYTSHPLAVTCRPCPPVVAGNNWVLFMAIGNHPLSRIFGTSQALAPTTTPANRGLTDGGAPWGGTLRPRLEFDSSLRDDLGVRYYRLSWKRNGEPNSAYRPMTGAIARHFAHMVGTDLVLDAYPLGPVTVGTQGGLYEIPPAIPPLGQWSIPDAVEDTANARFNSVEADGTPLLDDQIQIRLELFDTAGAAVDIGALGIRYFVPTSTDLGGTISTVDASSLGLVSGNTMVITLHMNNEGCNASIAAPTISGVEADPCCGVLNYTAGASVLLGWNPSHPHGFATYGFGVVRGVQSVYSASGAVAGSPFSVTRTVAQLLSDNLPATCSGPCSVAGFSENVYVYAAATDGWSRQSQYDASSVRAFVLSP